MMEQLQENDERVPRQNQLYKPKEVALMLNKPIRNIYQWMQNGDLKFLKIGKIKSIYGKEIMRFTGLTELPPVYKRKEKPFRPGKIVYFQKGEVNIGKENVYILKAENGLYKIGSSYGLETRLAGLFTIIPLDLELVAIITARNGLKREREIHAMFQSKRIRGEWFLLDNKDLSRMKLCVGYVEINLPIQTALKKMACAVPADSIK